MYNAAMRDKKILINPSDEGVGGGGPGSIYRLVK